MIRLIFTDVDGTLVGSAGDVHPEVWRAVERARRAGIRVVLCSGRPAFGVTRGLAERLDADGWHVFQNGASVLHLRTGGSLSARLAPEIVAMLVARARSAGRDLELYTDTEYAVESTSARARQHAELLGLPFAPRPFESLVGNIVRAQWLLDWEASEAVIAEPHPGLEVSPSTSPMMPDARFVNLTPAGIDKSVAVRAVAGEYGVLLDEVMYVGDGYNDATAMRAVGFPIAMANAEPEAKEAASLCVGHVDDGALAEAIDIALRG